MSTISEWVDARQARELGLSLRHQQVLVQIALGRTNGQIGRTLSITAYTVKSHLSGLLLKLGVHSRAEAVGRAFDCGLLRTRAMRDELARPRSVAS